MSNKSSIGFSTMKSIQNVLMQLSIPYIIVVSLVGMAGNILTIILLSKRSLTKNFNNCTLIALASTDLLFNLTLAIRCGNDFIELDSNLFCRFLSFFSHLAELLSAGFTVHFTIQRFIAVKFPLSVFIEKSFHHLHYLIISIFIILGIIFCSVLIHQNNYENCQEELDLFWFISDAFLSFFIPFTIIAVLNVSIIFHLRTTFHHHQTIPLRQQRRHTTGFSTESSSIQTRFSDSSTNIERQVQRRNEFHENYLSVEPTTHHRDASIRSTTRSHAQSHHVTRMLILVSTCFLLLNAPSHICTISLKIFTLKQVPMNRTRINSFLLFYIFMIITQHISYLSYSINFFLYSFCGMKFRREFIRFLSQCFPRRSHSFL